MTQTELQFLQEACVAKINSLLTEIVNNNNKAQQPVEKPKEPKKESK